jgi:DNA-binding NarL/FixJ family response regulator
MQKHSILIYTDSSTFSRSLFRFLETERDFIVVQVHQTGDASLSQIRHMCPEVILITLETASLKTNSLIRCVRDIFTEAILIVLTNDDSDPYRAWIRAEGADDVLAEEQIGARLIQVIRRQIERRSFRDY